MPVITNISHRDLGDMVGAYRGTVTKTLDEFQAGYPPSRRPADDCGLPTGIDTEPPDQPPR